MSDYRISDISFREKHCSEFEQTEVTQMTGTVTMAASSREM